MSNKHLQYLLLSSCFLLLGTLLFLQMLVSGENRFAFWTVLFFASSFLFRVDFEAFIVLILVVNQEIFNLLPSVLAGGGTFQDGLFFIVGVFFIVFLARGGASEIRTWDNTVLTMVCMALMAVTVAFFHGQPLVLGLKAAKGYYLILFYFVFSMKRIDYPRLALYIVLCGTALTFLNNLQYFYMDRFLLFHAAPRIEDVRHFRFLVGDFFTIFSPIVALGEFFRRRQILFLGAFFYMTGTVFLQGQTRSVIFGVVVSSALMYVFMNRVNLGKLAITAVLAVLLVSVSIPLFQQSFFNDLYHLTIQEIRGNQGNVGVRLVAYKYYYGKIMQSPIVGYGVWYHDPMAGTPQDPGHSGIYLSDVGIIGFLFHFGLVGLAFLTLVLIKIFRTLYHNGPFASGGGAIALFGYFSFSIITMPTLDTMFSRRTIIYLTLALALMTVQPHPEHREALAR